ncbi:hypothetical protein [Croceicoccus sp. Ery15]|uniref:hypothetical protein n=1 Tax=Croceicoccus sp. Ery15 TaxID=1703338 RepID=UPI001E58FEC7|nr:hypothetical protein [Croceicoccus sp. Ery15]
MQDVERQRAHVTKAYDPSYIEKLIAEETSGLQAAIELQDISKLLRYAPGKELLGSLSKSIARLIHGVGYEGLAGVA